MHYHGNTIDRGGVACKAGVALHLRRLHQPLPERGRPGYFSATLFLRPNRSTKQIDCEQYGDYRSGVNIQFHNPLRVDVVSLNTYADESIKVVYFSNMFDAKRWIGVE
jgi:hypothetical protein